VRPRPSVELHAHPVDEATTLEEHLLPLKVEGTTSNGTNHAAEIYLPHPLTFAMMKLFAFRDRSQDKNKEYGRYHALDLYAVLATASEEEWDQALELQRRHREEPAMNEATRIVKENFASTTSLGMLRMKESPYYRQEMQANEFLQALNELFSVD